MSVLAERWRTMSLTLRSAILFAVVAALVVSAAGGYLYGAMRQEMVNRSDLQVTGRIDYYRKLLSQRFLVERLVANTGLFENMLGNEQDVLIFQLQGQKPLINVNPARLTLPPVVPT
ncbi:two-component sensor histidine kinase, partial [Serratia rubidaea]|nr:two-component sensor histidine kinase [Serratia rubidaea]